MTNLKVNRTNEVQLPDSDDESDGGKLLVKRPYLQASVQLPDDSSDSDDSVDQTWRRQQAIGKTASIRGRVMRNPGSSKASNGHVAKSVPIPKTPMVMGACALPSDVSSADETIRRPPKTNSVKKNLGNAFDMVEVTPPSNTAHLGMAISEGPSRACGSTKRYKVSSSNKGTDNSSSSSMRPTTTSKSCGVPLVLHNPVRTYEWAAFRPELPDELGEIYSKPRCVPIAKSHGLSAEVSLDIRHDGWNALDGAHRSLACKIVEQRRIQVFVYGYGVLCHLL